MDVGAVEEELGTTGPTVDAAGVGVIAAGVAVGAARDEISGADDETSGGVGTAAFFMPSRCWRAFPPLPGRRRPDSFAGGGSMAARFAGDGSMAARWR